MSAGPDPMDFNESVDILRRLIFDADALETSRLHSFKELMKDYEERLPDGWYWDAFEELEAVGHLNERVSHKVGGGDACGRLSADGKAYVRAMLAEKA